MTRAVRYLIVNADDLGRTPGVNAGILRAHCEGIVTSATVMVNLPAAEAATRQAGAEAPGLGLGVHLNLTAGRPVLPARDVPTLVDNGGGFHPIRRLVLRLEQLNLDQVRAELASQIERFRAWGRTPTHLDAHHHALYLAPRLFRVLVALADQYRLPIRYPWPRQSIEVTDLEELAEAHRVDPADLPQIVTACHNILAQSEIPTTDRCVLSFYDAGATLPQLLELIASLPDGVSELMCHPGEADADLRETSGYAQQREAELDILTDPQVRSVLEAEGVELVNFSALTETRGNSETRSPWEPNRASQAKARHSPGVEEAP
ncbi:MAG: carbohydrate deacetylase [Anaerolineae bacterium]|jgi:predicted glycoside hydrolase/deacetylase ChbG (UPF0249 family)